MNARDVITAGCRGATGSPGDITILYAALTATPPVFAWRPAKYSCSATVRPGDTGLETALVSTSIQPFDASGAKCICLPIDTLATV